MELCPALISKAKFTMQRVHFSLLPSLPEPWMEKGAGAGAAGVAAPRLLGKVTPDWRSGNPLHS